MKKIKFTFLFYCTLLFLSIIFQSCYKCDRKITDLTGFWVEGLPSNVVIDSTMTIIRGEFTLLSLASLEVAGLYTNPGMIQTANAFGCGGYTIVNPIEESSVRISCDKDFKFDNTDILANASFHELLDIEVFDYSLGGLGIIFDSTFISKTEFEKEAFTFKIQSRTIDCLSFSNELTLQMDL